jgi:YggT family protein
LHRPVRDPTPNVGAREWFMTDQLADLVSLVLNVLTIAVIIRALLSWFDPTFRTPVGRIIFQVTEPIIRPIRQLVPSVGMFDLSPIIALLILRVMESFLTQALTS